MWRGFAVALLTLLSVPSLAMAGVADIPAGEQVAAGYWGGVPAHCPQGVTTSIVPSLVSGGAAEAEIGGCRTWYAEETVATMDAATTCMVVVHEWGHLHGHLHPPDPMDPTTPMSFAYAFDAVPGCAAMASAAIDRWVGRNNLRADIERLRSDARIVRAKCHALRTVRDRKRRRVRRCRSEVRRIALVLQHERASLAALS
jgi:hypothetical protein